MTSHTENTMKTITFFGVYSGKFPDSSDTLQKTSSEQQCYVWYNQKEKSYLVQPISATKNSNSYSYIVSPSQLSLSFSEENSRLPEPDLPNLKKIKIYKDDQSPIFEKVKLTGKKINQENKKMTIVRGNKENYHRTIIRDYEHEGHDDITVAVPHSEIFEDIPDELLGLEFTPEDFNYQNKAVPTAENQDEKSVAKLNREALSLDFRFKNEFNQAMSLWYKGRKNLARSKIEEILDTKDKVIGAHKHTFTNFAIQLRKVHQNDLAIKFALRCIELSPQDSHAYFNCGRLFYELRKYEDAENYLKKAVKLEPQLYVATKLSMIVKQIMQRHRKKYEAYL